MGKRGFPPKPTALKVLQGNPGHQKLNTNEPKPQPIAPICPSWLPPGAKRYWKLYASKLEDLGLLTEVDGLDFQNLCLAAWQIEEAAKVLKKQGLVMKMGSGYEQQRPEVGIVNNCSATIAKLGAKFGLSPADRVGLGVKPREQKSKFQAYLEKGKGKKQA
jgi:P27 family predicted phage terminase small subunit